MMTILLFTSDEVQKIAAKVRTFRQFHKLFFFFYIFNVLRQKKMEGKGRKMKDECFTFLPL